MKTNLLICCAVFCTVSVLCADDAKFKTLGPASEIQIAKNVSADGHAATLLFDSLAVSTSSGKGTLPDVVTKRFTYVFQFDNKQDAFVTQDIRGFLSATGSGNTVLLVQSAGKTTLVDLKQAVDQSNSDAAKKVSPAHQGALKAAEDMGFAGSTSPHGDHDYYYRIESRVAAGKPLQITLILLAERLPGDDGSGALLTVDSLDCEIHPITK